jgi:DNA-binding NarL/FixJ family response regulator
LYFAKLKNDLLIILQIDSLHRQPKLIEAMVDAGASGYVSKEDAYEDLIPAIRAVAAGENYFSESLPPPFGIGEYDPDDDPDSDDLDSQ